MASPHGIAIPSEKPNRLAQKLYAARRDCGHQSYSHLRIVELENEVRIVPRWANPFPTITFSSTKATSTASETFITQRNQQWLSAISFASTLWPSKLNWRRQIVSDSPSIDTISILLARDPFTLSKLDIDAIIEYYSARRKDFALSGKSAPRAEKARPTLDELGLWQMPAAMKLLITAGVLEFAGVCCELLAMAIEVVLYKAPQPWTERVMAYSLFEMVLMLPLALGALVWLLWEEFTD
jgi:hypothetical protein